MALRRTHSRKPRKMRVKWRGPDPMHILKTNPTEPSPDQLSFSPPADVTARKKSLKLFASEFGGALLGSIIETTAH